MESFMAILGTVSFLGLIFGALALVSDWLEDQEDALRNRYGRDA